jgi:hypothetical protein
MSDFKFESQGIGDAHGPAGRVETITGAVPERIHRRDHPAVRVIDPGVCEIQRIRGTHGAADHVISIARTVPQGIHAGHHLLQAVVDLRRYRSERILW